MISVAAGREAEAGLRGKFEFDTFFQGIPFVRKLNEGQKYDLFEAWNMSQCFFIKSCLYCMVN